MKSKIKDETSLSAIPVKISVNSTARGDSLFLAASNEKISLNETSQLIWSLIDGKRSIDEIVQILKSSYADLTGTQIAEIQKTIKEFETRELISIDVRKNEASSLVSKKKEDNLIQYLTLPPNLIWNLEAVRQIIVGILEVYPDKKITTEVDLSEAGLQEAIDKDIDTAGSNKTSQVSPYKNLTNAGSFAVYSSQIKKEIYKLLEIENAELVLRGTAYYRSKVSMGWHSNHGAPGIRVYCSWAGTNKQNFFRYLDPVSGHIITEWEPAGWIVKIFRIPKSPDRLWHCIYSESQRFALGYGIMD